MWRETKRNIPPWVRWKLKYVFLTKRTWHIYQKYCFGEHEKQLEQKKQAQNFARSYSRQGFKRASLGLSSPPSLNTPVLVSPSASSKHWDVHTDLGQHNSGFSFLLCQESCPSCPGLLLRIPDPGMVLNASQLLKPEERRGISSRTTPKGPLAIGQEEVQDPSSPDTALGTRSPLHPTGWGPMD